MRASATNSRAAPCARASTFQHLDFRIQQACLSNLKGFMQSTSEYSSIWWEEPPPTWLHFAGHVLGVRIQRCLAQTDLPLELEGVSNECSYDTQLEGVQKDQPEGLPWCWIVPYRDHLHHKGMGDCLNQACLLWHDFARTKFYDFTNWNFLLCNLKCDLREKQQK